jgi:TFIIF-interacting CTD phosphatase-like protein
VVIRQEGEARRQSEVVEQRQSYSPEQIHADLSGQQRYNTQRKHRPFEPKFAKRTIEESENSDPNKLQVKRVRQQTIDTEQVIAIAANPRSSSNPREKLLPEPKNPSGYTLVLDLDETLVHYDHKHRHFKVRPFAILFLREMAKYFEVVIFTAALQDYADSILNAMDKEHLVAHRLYRSSTRFKAGTYLKDLSRLGRDLSRCLIIDNMEDNF